MKVLVNKLEEYRRNEASMKDAIVNAQKTCDLMVKEAEAKCTQMLVDANAAAIENAKNADAMIEAEQARVEEARRAACAKIDTLKDEIYAGLKALDRIKSENIPTGSTNAFDYDRTEGRSPSNADAVAEEIAANLQALVGTADEAVPAVEPNHPVSDTTTTKFANLQFGRNYDPTKR